MVTSKDNLAAIITLHQNGLTCKKTAAKNIVSERTVYRMIKKFKVRGSFAAKKASGCPILCHKCQDRLLLRSALQNHVATSAEFAECWQYLHAHWGEDFWTMVVWQEGQHRSHFFPRKTLRTDGNSAGITRIGQQKNCALLSYFLWWILLPIVWDIWKIICLEKKRWAEPWLLCHANNEASWYNSRLGLLLTRR